MKRLIVLLLAFGILVASDMSRAARFADDKKPETKKDDKKAEAKKDDKKPETKKDDKKPEEKKAPESKPLTEAQKAAFKVLSGTFSVVEYNREGKKSPADELKKMKVVQNGAEWRFFVGDDITLGKDTVDPSKSPKEVDSYYVNGPAREKTVKGLYKVEGDTVTYIHADPGMSRPKGFDARPGSGLTLIVLKKQKAETAPDAKPTDKKPETKDKK